MRQIENGPNGQQMVQLERPGHWSSPVSRNLQPLLRICFPATPAIGGMYSCGLWPPQQIWRLVIPSYNCGRRASERRPRLAGLIKLSMMITRTPSASSLPPSLFPHTFHFDDGASSAAAGQASLRIPGKGEKLDLLNSRHAL